MYLRTYIKCNSYFIGKLHTYAITEEDIGNNFYYTYCTYLHVYNVM